MEEIKPDIILVDTNDNNISLLTRYFQMNNSGLALADHQNGLFALSRIKTIRPQLVIVNLMSRDFEPLSLVQNIRSSEEARDTNIIGLVSENSQFEIQKAQEMGVKTFATTPISIKELAAKINKYVNLSIDTKSKCRLDACLTNNIMILEVQGKLLLEDLLDHSVNILKGFDYFDEKAKKRVFTIFYDIDLSTLTAENLNLLFEFYSQIQIAKKDFVKILSNNNTIISELKRNKITRDMEFVKDYMDGIAKLQLAAVDHELGVRIEYLAAGSTLVGDIFEFSGRRLKKAYEVVTEADINKYKDNQIERVFYEKDLKKLNISVETSDSIEEIKLKKAFEALNPDNTITFNTEKTGPFSFLFNKTILIVDDEEAILDMLSHFFAQKGFNVYLVDDSKRGIEIAIDKKPDIILTDIMMPYFSGHDFVSTLNQKLGNRRPPIIVITGAPSGENVQKAKEAGVNGFIPKPLDFQTLFVKVAKELKNSQSKFIHS